MNQDGEEATPVDKAEASVEADTRLFSIGEVAHLSGYSSWTLRRLEKAGKIPRAKLVDADRHWTREDHGENRADQ